VRRACKACKLQATKSINQSIKLYFKSEASVRLCAPRSERALTLYTATDCAAAADISGVSGRWQLSRCVRRVSRYQLPMYDIRQRSMLEGRLFTLAGLAKRTGRRRVRAAAVRRTQCCLIVIKITAVTVV